jgi:hypothetical protein
MNRLLALTAVIESATGLALMVVPIIVVRLLLGAEITGASVPLGRVAGFALLSLGIACLPSRDSTGNTAAPARRAMLTYNLLATLFFLWLGIGGEFAGPLLWPAVGLHGILSILLVRQWWLGKPGTE